MRPPTNLIIHFALIHLTQCNIHFVFIFPSSNVYARANQMHTFSIKSIKIDNFFPSYFLFYEYSKMYFILLLDVVGIQHLIRYSFKGSTIKCILSMLIRSKSINSHRQIYMENAHIEINSNGLFVCSFLVRTIEIFQDM